MAGSAADAPAGGICDLGANLRGRGAGKVRGHVGDHRRRRTRGATRQHYPPLVDGLRPVLRQELQRPVDGGEKAGGEVPRCRFAGRFQNIRAAHDRVDAAHGIGRTGSRHRAVKGRAQGIDVGPRPLLFLSRRGRIVLLEGCIARRHQRRQRSCRDADGLPRGAEIQQHRGAALTQVNVVGLDVAMDEAGLVHDLQAVQQRHDQRAQLGFTGDFSGLKKLLQAFSAFVLHHHVGGAVGFEHAHHTHHVGMAEFRQGAGLGNEAIEPPAVGIAVILGDRVHVAVVAAGSELHGKEFFDGDALVEIRIQGQISDPEAALADHRTDHIPVQLVATWQSVMVPLSGHEDSSWMPRCAPRMAPRAARSLFCVGG